MTVTKQLILGDLRVHVPLAWDDITAELPGGTPFTLTRQDGLGALQFSTGRYVSGALPRVSKDDLLHLLFDRAASHHLGDARELTVVDADNVCVRGDFSSPAETCLLWYWSDRRSVVLATYVAVGGPTRSRLAAWLAPWRPARRIAQEAAEAQAIVERAEILYAPAGDAAGDAPAGNHARA